MNLNVIRKMLAIAGEQGNENECLNAVRMITALLARENKQWKDLPDLLISDHKEASFISSLSDRDYVKKVTGLQLEVIELQTKLAIADKRNRALENTLARRSTAKKAKKPTTKTDKPVIKVVKKTVDKQSKSAKCVE